MADENKHRYTVEFERYIGLSAYRVSKIVVEIPFGKGKKYPNGQRARDAAFYLADHYMDMFTTVRVIKCSGYHGVYERLYGTTHRIEGMRFLTEIDKATREEIQHYLDNAVVDVVVPDEFREYGPTVVQAYRLAATCHYGQTYGDKSYFSHVTDVAKRVMLHTAMRANTVTIDEEGYEVRQAIPVEIIKDVAVALLHDVIEDTNYTASEMLLDFGDDITKAVMFLSVDNKYAPKPRVARTAYMHKLWEHMDKNTELWQRVRLVKTADRLCNVQASVRENSRLLAVYREEHADTKKILCGGDVVGMWNFMDELLALR